MRNFFIVVFVVALIVVGIETFRPQAKFPAMNTSFVTTTALTVTR